MAKGKPTAVTLEGEKNAILALLSAGEDEHWQIGRHYNHIVDGELAQHAGFDSAAAFVAKELREIPQSTLTLYGAVARAFTEAQAKRHGVSKLGLLLTYERLTKSKPPSDPAKARIRVPSGKSVEVKAFGECSANELRAALRARTKGSDGASSVPAKDKKKIDALRKALFRAVGEHGHVALRAEVRGRETVLVIDGLPLAVVHAVAAALARV